MNIDKFTITSYDQITGFDRGTGTLDFVMDELTDFTLSQEEEKVDITGKGGRAIGSLKKNKRVTGSGTNGMLSGGALAVMLGTDVEDINGEVNNDAVIKITDILTVGDDGATTTATAVGTPGNEIGYVYVRDKDNAYISGGEKYTQTNQESVDTKTFKYESGTKKITFGNGDKTKLKGKEIIVFYYAKLHGKRITNDADKYSKVEEVFVDCTCQDACDNIFHGQFIIPRADFSGTFEIAGGSDPATQGFEFTSLPNICTGQSKLWDFIVFDDGALGEE